MAEVQESLLKISYNSLQQFVEDINRNFAIIQNSPLYKGVPGDEGTPGNPGLTGKRGSRFFFVRVDRFLNAYPNIIVNGSQITFDWINSQLKDLDAAKKLRQTLGLSDNDSFVAGDVIVLTNSKMIEYDDVETEFFDTNISFYQQNSLVSSIETKIEEYVKQYVDNNPTILSLQNIFEFYPTFAKVYASTGNTIITNRNSGASIFMPYFAGSSDNQGIEINNHKYFGFSAKVFPNENNGTLVVGSMQKYTDLLNKTVSLIQANHYTSAYTPNNDSIPAMVVLQDTINNGIMFGYKESGNIARFGSIFKDFSESTGYEQSNVHIRSDQGEKNNEDFSEILLNKYRLRYAKTVFFGDDLTVDKDLHLGKNFDTEWIRTAEYLASKYSTKLDSNVDKRTKTIEIGWVNRTVTNGYYSPNTYYRNLSENIELPAFSAQEEHVVLTLAKDGKGNLQGVNGSLLRNAERYFIEERYITSDVDNGNLFDIKLIDDTEVNLKHRLISTWHLKQLIDRINATQQYIIKNYWRRDEWESTDRGDISDYGMYIPNLNIANKVQIGGDVSFGIDENKDTYLRSNKEKQTVTVGYENSKVLSEIQLVSRKIFIENYNKQNIVNATQTHIVTTNNQGYLTDTYGIWNFNSISESILDKLTGDTSIINDSNLLVTVKQLGKFAAEYKQNTDNINNETWRKKDFTANANAITGEDDSETLNVGRIPNIFVKNTLGGQKLILDSTITGLRSLNTVKLGFAESHIRAFTKLSLSSNTIHLNGSVKTNLDQNHFVTTSNDTNKYLITEFTRFNSAGLINDTVGLEQVNWPNIAGDLTKQLLTAETLKWINTRINNIVGTNDDENGEGGSGLLGNYYKKSEYFPTNGIAIIPDLRLKNQLIIGGNSKFGDYFSGENGLVTLGSTRIYKPNGYRPALDKLQILFPNIVFSNFKKKVLVTYGTGESLNGTLVSGGELRNDIEICEDTNLVQNLDNEVPTGSRKTDSSTVSKDNKQLATNEEILNASASQFKTQDEHKLLSGKQFAWIQTFINNVKKRFINTFNRKESIDYVYDHMPTGSIIMWTKTSYTLSTESLKSLGLADSKISEKFINSIPKGWVVCNGQKITVNGKEIQVPNLTNLFVRGVNDFADTEQLSGQDSITIEHKYLPDLTHNHICDDRSIPHRHFINATPANSDNMFDGKVWSNKTVTKTKTISSQGYCDINNAHAQTTKYILPLGNFEIPMVYKNNPDDNVFGLMNYRHKNDDKDKNWRRYDFDASRNDDATIISSNLTTIFKNFSASIDIELSDKWYKDGDILSDAEYKAYDENLTNHDHSIQNKDPRGNGVVQEKLPTIPRYYTVLYIMKVDSRITGTNHSHSEYVLQ